ncbi:MAG: exoribonuclease II, partial [Gammaproteobacteria bacterium]
MSDNKIQTGSLVLYKIRPAIVEGVGEKFEIRFEDGRTKRVRQKDIKLLHPGPVKDFSELAEPPGNLEEAWELLEGEETTLPELAELIYGEYSPASAGATWRLLDEELYFEGSLQSIRGRSAAAVRELQEARERKAREAREQAEFLERLQRGELLDG